MQAKTIRTWYFVHKWASLVCTLFMLLLCLTGLPLIFHEEIEHALGTIPEAAAMPAGTKLAPVDRVVAAAEAAWPGQKVQYVSWDEHEPELAFASLQVPGAPPDEFSIAIADARTAEIIAKPDINSGFMYVMLTLHVDLFAGLPGKLFLGLMGILLVTAIVSGVVLYAPFMRRLDFGTVRRARGSRLKWLDLHNLLGIVTVAWLLVVGGTGVINTWADLVIQFWRYDQLQEMTAPYASKPAPERYGSIDAALAAAKAAVPDMTPSFVAFPGSLLSSNHHYMVAMHGSTPLTTRLIKPVLVDAVTAELTETRDMPWYVTTLLVSQPLHFGDYGGLPLKIIWAFLDLAAIVVLGSGLYLWLARNRRSSVEERLAHIAAAHAKPAE
ncbi:MAG TPA: PepSY domain-containing protein [Dongiaceae bacterium]|nr:PepSY domain-containing protein [Dongiaceae bacterium]